MSEKWRQVFSAIAFLAFFVLWFVDPTYSADESKQFLLKSVVLHGIGILIFLPMLWNNPYRIWKFTKWKQMILCLPALLVAVNNFPFLGVFTGEIEVVRPDLIFLYVWNCLFIGAFEEIAFRGFLYLFLLEKRNKTKKQIFVVTVISSAIFGLFHLLNLLEGADIGATALQLGYSFLIGGMCAVVLLKTENLLFSILLHGIYDLGGTFLSSGVAEGVMWDVPTVIWTAMLGVFTFAWMLFLLFRTSPEDVQKIF